MDAEEVVDRRLCVWGEVGVLIAEVDVIHQMNRPEEVIDVDDVLIGATKVGDLVVEQIVHVVGLRMQLAVWIGEDGLCLGNRGGAVVVHGPDEGDAAGIAGHGERVFLLACAFGGIAVIFNWL